MGHLGSSYCHLLLFLSLCPYLCILTSILMFGSEQPSALNLNIWCPPCSMLKDNLIMPPGRMSQQLHSDEAPPQEPIIPPPPNHLSTQILPTIVEAPEHPALENIHEVHLHQPINTTTTIAEPSYDTATSSQATVGAPRQSLSRAPSPIHILLANAKIDHIQINDWDEEAEEEAAAAAEEELAGVQQEIERLWQEQESILRRQAAMQRSKVCSQIINREQARLT
jgi:hypothetical protein